MTQISRPFVIALAAVVLFAGVWFVALKPHSTSSSSESSGSTPTSSTSTPAPSAAAQEKEAAAPSHVAHTSTPGLEGLTRDINKAHGAVARAQHNGQRVEEKVAQASGLTGSQGHSQAPSSGATAAAPAGGSTTSTHSSGATTHAPTQPSQTQTKTDQPSKSEPSKTNGSEIPAGQANVEKLLKEGKVALVLFWNSKSTTDKAVHEAVQLVSTLHHFFEPFAANPETEKLLKSHGISLQEKIGVLESPASKVASYGNFTRTVPVYQTPTVLIVNPLGQVSEIQGLTDAYVIEQRIGESRAPSH